MSVKGWSISFRQSSFVVAASIAWSVSLPSVLSKKKTFPPATTGDASPSPTLIFQAIRGSPGSFSGTHSPSGTWPSRNGPRHWGQSDAQTDDWNTTTSKPMAKPGGKVMRANSQANSQGVKRKVSKRD